MIFTNQWLSASVIAWLIAQLMKMVLNTIATRRIDFSRLVDSGGMPSSHTAFVSALCTAVAMTEGMNSVVFAAVACFSMIIIYDATNLRRSAGYHAQVLNEVVPQLLKGKVIKDGFIYPRLRELLGHNPVEVFVGAIVGIISSFWFVNWVHLRLE